MDLPFNEKLERAKSLPDIFELVKEVVLKTAGARRSGLMLGIAELGGDQNRFIGAFYPVPSNIIVMNKTPLKAIRANTPKWEKPYIFLVLMHEYIHALGEYDEARTREKAAQISKIAFGENHIITGMASDIGKYVHGLVYSDGGWDSEKEFSIELVKGFDYGNQGYIS